MTASSEGGSAVALPLTGVTVIEVSSFVAAPLCGMTLGQLGAEVIRVDPIGGAADFHRWPLAASGTSIYWTGLNKGKRSATIDLRSVEGQQLVQRLIVEGDGIVVTNAAGMSWMAYDQLVARRCDVIHVQLLGRRDGSTGVDYTVNAATGYPMVTGPKDHAGPINHVLPAWDVCCGLYAALTVMAAVHRRDQSGVGAQISLALEDIALATAGNLGMLTEPQVNGTQRQRLGNAIYGQYGQDFRSRDGVAFMVVALTARHFRDLVEVSGVRAALSALAEALDVDFTTEADRYRYRDVLTGLFGTWFAEHTADEITEALSATTVLFERYRTFAQVAAESRVTANPLFHWLHQEGLGDYLAPGLPAMVDGVHPATGPAPVLGSDTASVLTGYLGLSPNDIARLTDSRTIACTPAQVPARKGTA
ncbi:MAG: CoA transferase [Mycobacteriaceae bacterium]|nr:CoA transferase [Mycobacteriaceae bacterium]